LLNQATVRLGLEGNMNARRLESRSRHEVEREPVLDLLAQSETPALATDGHGQVVFWNRAAERVLGRISNRALGRRCYDVMGGRDVFGNRFCYEVSVRRSTGRGPRELA
jgi:PAS domain-containing protein